MDDSSQQIESAIAALKAQRAVLGDAVLATALAPLERKLADALLQQHAEQQLKSVTVLFMDVVGSTRMSQHLDPEDVHAVMNSILERLTAIVEARRGRVLQYAGDSLLAVFGAEQALEDDAERAVHAGLAILTEVPRLAAEVKARHGHDGFNLRVGIHTGPVLLGGGVDAQGSIRGITVNIAARMEQTAPPGTLRFSHDTYRHVRGVFDVLPQEPIEMKGIDGAMRSYLVERAKPRSFRMANRGVEGVTTQMVGRDAELARLIETFQTMADEGAMALVTVVGEPGIGKSRLGLEFTDWIELLPEPVRYFRARPQPYGNNVPFGMLRDLLAWRFEILDGDAQAAAKAKLAEGLAPVLGDRAEEYTALIGQLIGLDFDDDPHIAGIAEDARQIRDRAFHALSQYFRLLHRQDEAPVLLLLDDLHWADEGSLDFINHLARTCADTALMAVCLTRATLYERRPLWGSGQDNHQRIDLTPLTRRGSRELVEALLSRLDTVPMVLRDLLTGSAEGNPYFVEELVSMLIDDGVIVTGPERWHVNADKLLEVHVPGTLAGVLQARIDGLPAAEKAALQNASVIGHVFWDEALREIAPQTGDALDNLARRELTYGRETSAFEGTREYVFKHHVLHQVTYQSVLKRPRREQHRLAADWLVLRSGDRTSEYFGAIADHYERAGEATQAIAYLRKAGDDAARSYVNQAALEFFGRALALVPADDAATRFALLRSRRAVYSFLGQRAEQEVDVAALEELAETLDDDAFRAHAAGMRASLALVVGDYPKVTAAAERAVACAASAGDRSAALSARINWARALQFQGDYAGAEAHMKQSLELAREVGDRRVESTSLSQLGIHALQRGDYGRARACYREALGLARANGDRALESGVINNLGDVEQLLGNYAAALELFEQGRKLCAEIGQRQADAYLLCNMAGCALRRGDAAEAIEWSEQAIGLALTLKDPDLQASLMSTRGHAFSALGRHDEAAASYRDATALYRKIGRPTMVPEPVAGLARLALKRQSIDEAVAHIDSIVAHFDAGGTVDGTEDPLWIYLTCHVVLGAAGAPRGAEFLSLGHRLLMQRAEPLAAAERASFLGSVPSHYALIAAWAEADSDA